MTHETTHPSPSPAAPAPTGAVPPQEAVIFDLDGVVTDTATLHAQAWRQLFAEVLTDPRTGGPGAHAPFDEVGDYRRYVDGRSREDGVAAFLVSRGIDLPVYFGNRNWHPMVEDTLARMQADGVRRALVFPTSMGRFYEWEDRGMHRVLGDAIGAGHLQLRTDRDWVADIARFVLGYRRTAAMLHQPPQGVMK